MSDRTWTIVILIAVTAVVGAWDIYVAFGNREQRDTVSSVISETARRHPFLPFAAGLLAGHWFW